MIIDDDEKEGGGVGVLPDKRNKTVNKYFHEATRRRHNGVILLRSRFETTASWNISKYQIAIDHDDDTIFSRGSTHGVLFTVHCLTS